MKKVRLIFILFLAVFITGCFEEDSRIFPLEIRETKIQNSLYEYQTYFNLETNSVVAFNHYTDWDLGFDATPDGYKIILNYSRFMYAGNTFSTDFYSVNSNTIASMSFDNSDGDPEKSVFLNWADFTNKAAPVFYNHVYIIDRGVSELGEKFGMKKIVIEKMERDTFYVHFANLDNTEDHFFKIPKIAGKNYTLFSFNNAGNIDTQEPDSDSWDLCFTKYSTVIPDDYGTPTPYIVRGVYTNYLKGVEVAMDTISSYYEISREFINSYNFLKTQDAIGYEWKIYKNEIYEIVNNKTYIIKNPTGIYFKMRFTSYYNQNGEKGFPSFELSDLN
jgi:hypothetical protein